MSKSGGVFQFFGGRTGFPAGFPLGGGGVEGLWGGGSILGVGGAQGD